MSTDPRIATVIRATPIRTMETMGRRQVRAMVRRRNRRVEPSQPEPRTSDPCDRDTPTLPPPDTVTP